MTKRMLLNRLRPKFVSLVKKYLAENKLNNTELAKIVDMQRSHLSALLNNSPERGLSGYYIQKFIGKGIFTVNDIYDGKPGSKREAEFWSEASESDNWELLKFISKIRREKKVDILSVLKSIYPDVK